MSKMSWIAVLFGCLLFGTTCCVSAQGDGTVVKLVVPYAPGGFPDTISRLVANQISIETSRRFVIENRPGGAGTIAADFVARSTPDGNTLLVADAQQWAIAPAMLKSIQYNVQRDFAPVTLLGTSGNFLVINPALGVTDFPGLIALIKANPGKFNYGTPGVGTIHHMTLEVLKSRLKLQVTQIPYRGGSEVIPAVLAGNAHFALQALPAVGALAKEGRLNIVAVALAQRSRLAPNVPTMEELGVPNMDFPGAIGILAPAGTPPGTISRLPAAMNAALLAPDVTAKLAAYAIEPSHLTPLEFNAFIAAEIVKFRNAVENAGLASQ